MMVLPYQFYHNKSKIRCQPTYSLFVLCFFLGVIYFAVPGFSQNWGSVLKNEFKAKVGAFSANLKDDIA